MSCIHSLFTGQLLLLTWGGGVGHCCRILLPNAKNPQWGKAIKEAIDTEGYMS